MGDTSYTFESYCKRAASPLIVPLLLKDHVMCIYQISQAMKKMSDGRCTIAVLFPTLYRLKERGYIQVNHMEVINNRPGDITQSSLMGQHI